MTFLIETSLATMMASWFVAIAAADPATVFFRNPPQEIDVAERGDSILFANRQIGIQFKRVANGFQLAQVYDIKQGHDFLPQSKTNEFQDLFQIRMALDPHKAQGVFCSEDGDLGVFVANASQKDLNFSANLELSQYGFPDGAIAQAHQIHPDETSEPLSGQTKDVLILSDTLPARHITMFYIKQDSQR